ncbi:diaminopimelate epimerase [Paludisphaera rhizosphaerae]|uniref:diaminopimelate epimerase n=1 Tax=Paludisphaera rhizosphaerae TaxID=2711216 RepID=UPI0013EA2BD4|nr:diaminopimelate epimerase [Paludisphaera rhizosphaerae]
MKFTKMHGLGNDYVYVETFTQPEPADFGAIARAVSDRHFGIGSDGLIAILPSDRADARMRMFNVDGSEGEMCGNGVRCVAKYIHDHGIAKKPRVTVETGRGVLTLDLTVEGGEAKLVRVDMGTPILNADAVPTTLPGDPVVEAPVEIGGKELKLTAVSMGNPHAVLFVDDVDAFPLETLGPLIERHPVFPKRVNFHVAQVVSPSEVKMRTWERGSGITMACGTGACSVCVAGVLTGRTGPKVLAHLPGGDLELEWASRDASVLMTGPATEVFSGEWRETGQ